MKNIPSINLKKQYNLFRLEIDTAIQNVLNHGQFILGPEVKELEEKLAEFTNVNYCITAASGTDALLMALMAIGIKPGDEVITSPFSFFATAEVISLLGAKPVFVDIRSDTFNINEKAIEAAITPKTKAILPVSLYGQCPDFAILNQIANHYDLPIIEDGAQSFGSLYKNQKSCGLSQIGCTSFFPTKPLSCFGDGGACFTNDPMIAEALRTIRNHGQQSRFYHLKIGINGRLDTLQAAILLTKLTFFPQEIDKRREIASLYDQLLHPSLKKPYISPHNRSTYSQYTI